MQGFQGFGRFGPRQMTSGIIFSGCTYYQLCTTLSAPFTTNFGNGNTLVMASALFGVLISLTRIPSTFQRHPPPKSQNDPKRPKTGHRRSGKSKNVRNIPNVFNAQNLFLQPPPQPPSNAAATPDAAWRSRCIARQVAVPPDEQTKKNNLESS